MAMITIERIVPAATQVQNDNVIRRSDGDTNAEQANDENQNDLGRNSENISNEIYIAVRGADIIFPHNECHRYSKTSSTTSISELIQKHLQAILQILRPQDTMRMAVRLETQLSLTRTRYLLVVSNETDQSCLLGIDYENEATIGLVLSIWNDMQIMLDGDGGFRITTGNRHHIFKPVSVQAMWSIFQALHLATKKSIKHNYYEGGGSHQWVVYYQNNIKSDSRCLHEWHTIVADQSDTNYNVHDFKRPKDNFEKLITSKLKQVMVSVDLEQVTSKEIRNRLEAHFQRNLSDYKSYIDEEMIRMMGQLEEASKILDYLYLGSEWNASNFEELKIKGVQKILNVTSEIDNYFPEYFDYYNIRVDDDEATNMLRHLNDTYYYIRKAKDEGVKVLVHCKKGISRSASVVVAYIMKEKCYDLDKALHFVRNQRSTIRPNPEFLKQLEIYQGMLHASNNKKKSIWKSNSDSELQTNKSKNYDGSESNYKRFSRKIRERMFGKEECSLFSFKFQRRKSWPPKNNVFGVEENKIQNSQDDSFFCEDNKDFKNYGLLGKFEAKSRVKERIEDFESKQPATNETKSCNSLKKNAAKPGLVSNLAFQFEAKEAMNDVSNVDNGQRVSKPPIPPVKNRDERRYHTINLSRSSCKNGFSRQFLKRTLSSDNIVERCNIKNVFSNDSSLKKCKKSLHPPANTTLSAQLPRTCSLPNLVEEPGVRTTKMVIPSKKIPKSSIHPNAIPLDLHFLQYLQRQYNKDKENEGFVKRRTEEFEKSYQSMSIIANSMPSSPNLSTEQYVQKKSFPPVPAPNNSQVKISRSFNCPSYDGREMTPQLPVPSLSGICSADTLQMNLESQPKAMKKKTYGRTHPLDKLNLKSTSRTSTAAASDSIS